MLDWLFNKNKAVIIETNLNTGNVNVSDDFQSVPIANNALSHIVSNDPDTIAFDKSINDYEGVKYNTVRRKGKSEIWETTDMEVLPSNLFDDPKAFQEFLKYENKS